MNIKSSIKYQLVSVMKAFFIFYGIVTLFRALGVWFALVGDGKLHMSGTEVNSIIFMGFLGAFTFLDDFRFLIQNGYSRKSMIASFLIEFCIMAALLSSVDILFEGILKSLDYQSLFVQLYGIQNIMYQFLWGFLLNMLTGILVFLVTVLSCRMTKQQKFIFLMAVPLVLVMGIILLETQYTNGAIVEWLLDKVYLIFGFGEQSIQYWNPICYLSVASLFFIGLSYLAARRAPINI